MSILQENKSGGVPNQLQPQSNFIHPPPKSMRISDMYFPDPMFYPGYYPTGMMNPYDPYNRGGFNNNSNGNGNDLMQMYDKMSRINNGKNFMHNDFDKYERNRVNQIPKDRPRFNALSEFVNTVHNIHSRGNKGSYSSGGVKSNYYGNNSGSYGGKMY